MLNITRKNKKTTDRLSVEKKKFFAVRIPSKAFDYLDTYGLEKDILNIDGGTSKASFDNAKREWEDRKSLVKDLASIDSDIISEEMKTLIIGHILKIDTNEIMLKEVEEDNSMYFSEMLEEFIRERSLNDIEEKQINEYRNQLNYFIEVYGDITMNEITNKVIDDYKAVLNESINGNTRKSSKLYKDKSLEEIIKMSKPENHKLSITTKNKYLTTLKGVLKLYKDKFDFDYQERYIKKFKSVVEADSERDAFTEYELNILITGETIMNKIARVFYYTGMRPSELLKGNIKNIEGYNVFTLKKEDIGRKKLKRAASYRYIPIHKNINKDIKEVIKYFEDCKGSENASKNFTDFLKDLNIYTPKKTLYSLRHNLTTALLQKDVIEAKADVLTGHALKGETLKRYGKGFKISQLVEAINKLD